MGHPAGVNDFLAAVEAGSPNVVAYPFYAFRAELRVATGDAPGAVADEMLRAVGSKPDGVEARFWAARALLAEGRREEADEQLGRALAFYRSVRATRYADDCEALFSPPGS